MNMKNEVFIVLALALFIFFFAWIYSGRAVTETPITGSAVQQIQQMQQVQRVQQPTGAAGITQSIGTTQSTGTPAQQVCSPCQAKALAQKSPCHANCYESYMNYRQACAGQDVNDVRICYERASEQFQACISVCE
jgi:hypothetical protein